MATFVKYQCFVKDLAGKVHNLNAAGDTVKACFSNTAPNVATHTVRADVNEIAAGSGYTLGGTDVQNDLSSSGGTTSLTGVDFTTTASGGDIAPFRYVILYNDTAANDPLIAYADYGSQLTVLNGNSFTVDFGASLLTIA